LALITAARQQPVNSIMQVQVYTYAAMVAADTGAPLAIGDLSEVTVQAYGNFTGGGSIKLQGSNDPRVITDSANAVWFDMNDSAGALSFSAAGAKLAKESPYFVRPVVTGTVVGVQLAISGKRMVKG